MKATRTNVQPVVSYPREAVVSVHQLAAGLGVSVRIALGLDLPFVMIGRRPRFVWGQVLDVLAERALPTVPERDRGAAAKSIAHRRRVA